MQNPNITFSGFTRGTAKDLEAALARAKYLTPLALDIEVVDDASIFPVGFFGMQHPPSYQCGAYTSDGAIIESTILQRGPSKLSCLPKQVDRSQFREFAELSTAVYGGFLTGHYGHCLIESIARLWPLLDRPSIPVIFCGAHRISPLIRKLATEYTAPRKAELVVPNRPIKIRRLLVPTPTMVVKSYAHSEHGKPIRDREKHSLGDSAKRNSLIYLSRSKLKSSNRPILNETSVEECIIRVGGLVYHPQEHALDAQVREISCSDLVVTSLGSAAHTLLLSASSHKVLYLSMTTINLNYPLVDSILGNEAEYLNCLTPTDDHMGMGRQSSICRLDMLERTVRRILGSRGLYQD